MDPATLATAVTAFLATAMSTVAQTVVDQSQTQLPTAVSQLWNSILARFKGKSAAEASANDLQAEANDVDNQEAFAVQLKKLLKNDPTFAAEVASLFLSAQGSAGISNSGDGAVATQDSVASGAGGIAVGGNVGGSIVLGDHNRINDDVQRDHRRK